MDDNIQFDKWPSWMLSVQVEEAHQEFPLSNFLIIFVYAFFLSTLRRAAPVRPPPPLTPSIHPLSVYFYSTTSFPFVSLNIDSTSCVLSNHSHYNNTLSAGLYIYPPIRCFLPSQYTLSKATPTHPHLSFRPLPPLIIAIIIIAMTTTTRQRNIDPVTPFNSMILLCAHPPHNNNPIE